MHVAMRFSPRHSHGSQSANAAFPCSAAGGDEGRSVVVRQVAHHDHRTTYSSCWQQQLVREDYQKNMSLNTMMSAMPTSSAQLRDDLPDADGLDGACGQGVHVDAQATVEEGGRSTDGFVVLSANTKP